MTHIRVKEYLFELLGRAPPAQAARDERPPPSQRLGEAHGQQRRVRRAETRRPPRGTAPAALAEHVRLPGHEQVEREHRPVEHGDPERGDDPVAPVAPEDEAPAERVQAPLQRRGGAERRAVAVQRAGRPARTRTPSPRGAAAARGRRPPSRRRARDRSRRRRARRSRGTPPRRRRARRASSSRGRRRARSTRGPTTRRSHRARRRPSRRGRDGAAGSGRPPPCPRRDPRRARPSARRSPARGRRRCSRRAGRRRSHARRRGSPPARTRRSPRAGRAGPRELLGDGLRGPVDRAVVDDDDLAAHGLERESPEGHSRSTPRPSQLGTT